MQAQTEREYDEYERMAVEAIMRERAHRAKRAKASDLFKRPIRDEEAKDRTKSLKEQAEHATAWLSQFEQFNEMREEEDISNG